MPYSYSLRTHTYLKFNIEGWSDEPFKYLLMHLFVSSECRQKCLTKFDGRLTLTLFSLSNSIALFPSPSYLYISLCCFLRLKGRPRQLTRSLRKMFFVSLFNNNLCLFALRMQLQRQGRSRYSSSIRPSYCHMFILVAATHMLSLHVNSLSHMKQIYLFG